MAPAVYTFDRVGVQPLRTPAGPPVTWLPDRRIGPAGHETFSDRDPMRCTSGDAAWIAFGKLADRR
jgi:hypothetical protein